MAKVGVVIYCKDLERMHDMMYVQLQSVDSNPYMAGMYNGMEFVLSSLEKREPIYYSKEDLHPSIKKQLIAISIRNSLEKSDELQPHY